MYNREKKLKLHMRESQRNNASEDETFIEEESELRLSKLKL